MEWSLRLASFSLAEHSRVHHLLQHREDVQLRCVEDHHPEDHHPIDFEVHQEEVDTMEIVADLKKATMRPETDIPLHLQDAEDRIQHRDHLHGRRLAEEAHHGDAEALATVRIAVIVAAGVEPEVGQEAERDIMAEDNYGVNAN